MKKIIAVLFLALLMPLSSCSAEANVVTLHTYYAMWADVLGVPGIQMEVYSGDTGKDRFIGADSLDAVYDPQTFDIQYVVYWMNKIQDRSADDNLLCLRALYAAMEYDESPSDALSGNPSDKLRASNAVREFTSDFEYDFLTVFKENAEEIKTSGFKLFHFSDRYIYSILYTEEYGYSVYIIPVKE